MQQEFNSNGVFWRLLIEVIGGEVLIYKNNEEEPFYYFDTNTWHSNFKRHMADKNWFTKEMSDFINSQIPN